ncbi:MAG: M23 family metallopeptidase, partial [Nitrososphaera sp.]|nr:M23 family metallopeptidase [Nitrososphaera sp.]
PPPPLPVAVPRYFEEYAEAITKADKMITESLFLFKDLNETSLANIQNAFQMPIKKPVVRGQLRLPGDPRPYRNDIHQGIDIYGLSRNEKIYPIAPGVIIRTDKSYVALTKGVRDKMLALSKTKWNGTPGSIYLSTVEEPYGNVLDKLRGRQVWVYHGKNKSREPILSMYAHLASVNEELKAYDVVGVDKVIGFVGNSGTSGEVENKKGKEVHLHFEIFIGDRYWTPKGEGEIGKMQDMARYQKLQEIILKLIPVQ